MKKNGYEYFGEVATGKVRVRSLYNIYIAMIPTYRRGIPSIPRVSTIIIPLHCLIIKKQITFKLLEV